MDFFESIRTKALYDYYKPDLEARLRHIYRWYSKTFHTPLHLVEDLPTYEVMRAYYEDTFEIMEDVERKEALHELMYDESERVKKAKADEDDEEKFLARLKAEAAAKAPIPKKVTEVVPQKPKKLDLEAKVAEPLISMKFDEDVDSMEPSNLR